MTHFESEIESAADTETPDHMYRVIINGFSYILSGMKTLRETSESLSQPH